MQSLSPHDKKRIKQYLFSGKRIVAIKYYRQVMGCSLKDAIFQINVLIEKERQTNPQAFYSQAYKNYRKKKNIVILASLLLIVPAAVFIGLNFHQLSALKSFHGFKNYLIDQPMAKEFRQFWEKIFNHSQRAQ